MSQAHEIKQFILRNFLFTDDPSTLDDDDSLMQKGVVDSTGILEMIMHLEDTYGITVADDEMVPDNLDSVSSIVQFLERKRSA
jgi:acyl carrier protein